MPSKSAPRVSIILAPLAFHDLGLAMTYARIRAMRHKRRQRVTMRRSDRMFIVGEADVMEPPC